MDLPIAPVTQDSGHGDPPPKKPPPLENPTSVPTPAPESDK